MPPVASRISTPKANVWRASTGLAVQLFWRHVGRRTNERARLCDERCDAGANRLDARQAEIENLDATVRRAHDVLGFQIAVHDAHGVSAGECGGQLSGGVQPLRQRGRRAVVYFLTQRAALDEFSDEVQLTVDFFQCVNGADPRMSEAGRGSGFASQALTPRRVRRQIVWQGLQRDCSV
jgi:hypothetical protein